ncbi:DNA repair protein Dds20/Mei5 [Blastomyces dermatitidis ER-3]|uniref:DNA repair protein Dds20/Mei5 n=1 Tax=Ajellomyces dermatitidis (strain ER-3 / ATCC MYA-2586) TaxID=559297 RepID=A0ABX2VW03_AJEDR|nr:DNA repair protein Dds20/Mei5 [Blastomyces dermatitidis ER-3]OAT01335.1 DNA repair protein Dds20/Mei5 [Blastomyces dermatitidis ER-3]
MSFHAAKRRRLDQATHTLSKPFKSPLRKQIQNTSAENGDEKADGVSKSIAPVDDASHNTTISAGAQHSPHTPRPASAAIKRPTTIPPTPPPTISTPSPSAPPELLALQKQYSALTTRLAKLRMDLDIVTQALKLEQSGKDAELEVLVAKWKTASREAAEELFVGAEERVKRMGGVKGWRENMRKAQERRTRWDEDERDVGGKDEMGSEGGEVERRIAEMEGEIEGLERRSDGKDGNRDKIGEGDEGESFTMDMMLKSLNIELDIIGFDKDTQQWSYCKPNDLPRLCCVIAELVTVCLNKHDRGYNATAPTGYSAAARRKQSIVL